MALIHFKKENLKKLKYPFFSLLSVVAIIVVLFLLLPIDIQQSLAWGIYIISAVFGIFLGVLLSRLNTMHIRLLKEKEEFRKKNNEIHSYMANVVHDLRSPMATIYMISELLENDLESIRESERELLTTIKNTSSSMLDRICYILDNSRLEKGLNSGNMIAGNPYEVLIEAVKKHHILAIEKNIEIDFSQVDEFLINVQFEKEALDSVFCNLISNAIKYSMPDTKISIASYIEKDMIRFSVQDQGLGMTSDDLEKVFGEFTRLSTKPTGNEPSSGLGLSIVKKFVEAMGGEVFAFSEGKGKGATFSFTLKLKNKR